MYRIKLALLASSLACEYPVGIESNKMSSPSSNICATYAASRVELALRSQNDRVLLGLLYFSGSSRRIILYRGRLRHVLTLLCCHWTGNVGMQRTNYQIHHSSDFLQDKRFNDHVMYLRPSKVLLSYSLSGSLVFTPVAQLYLMKNID